MTCLLTSLAGAHAPTLMDRADHHAPARACSARPMASRTWRTRPSSSRLRHGRAPKWNQWWVLARLARRV